MTQQHGHILSFGISALVHAGVIAALAVGVVASERAINMRLSQKQEIRVSLAAFPQNESKPVDMTDPAKHEKPVGRMPELPVPESGGLLSQTLRDEPVQISAYAKPPAVLMASWAGVTDRLVMPEPMPQALHEQPLEPTETRQASEPMQAKSEIPSKPDQVAKQTGSQPGSQPNAGQAGPASQNQSAGHGAKSAENGSGQTAQLQRLIHPEYPRVSRERGEEGRVVVRVRVMPDGSVSQASIEKTSGHKRLDAAALKAARDCKFMTVSGADGESERTLAFVFRLDQTL